MPTKDETTGLCCLGLIALVVIAWIFGQYGVFPFVVVGVTAGAIYLLNYRQSRKQKQVSEEAAARQRMDILDARIREERFEREQIAKGLEKYTDKQGNVRWGTPEEVAKWRTEGRTIRETIVERRETIVEKEIVKIRCQYCGTMFDAKLDKCPHCGAKQ